MDGGFTDSLPILPVGRTITVSPFAGEQDVCPVHRGRFHTQLRLANMNVMVSAWPFHQVGLKKESWHTEDFEEPQCCGPFNFELWLCKEVAPF